MKLGEAKKLYQNEWIAFKKNGNGENPDGEILLFDILKRNGFQPSLE